MSLKNEHQNSKFKKDQNKLQNDDQEPSLDVDELYQFGGVNPTMDDQDFKRVDSKNSINTNFLHRTGDSVYKS